ncbi:MAG: proline dehydrogenase family protein, partial [Thermaerobacterales bacterium]
AAESARLQRAVQDHGMRVGAARFVAGETLGECVAVIRRLNDGGLHANTTLLGEAIPTVEGADVVVGEYERILDRLVAEGLRANVALKLTHLGLDLGEKAACANLQALVAHAAGRKNFIRIDMEESARVDATLRIYRRLRHDGYNNVGAVLQSYLYRSEADLRALLPLRPNLRVVKGAYLEPPELAYPKKSDVDRNYIRLTELSLSEAAYTAVATHDDKIIDHVKDFARRKGIGPERFEFQMLFGVRTQYQLDLAAEGYRVLVAVPYGPEWYPYLMRRLAERPANLLFMMRNFFR